MSNATWIQYKHFICTCMCKFLSNRFKSNMESIVKTHRFFYSLPGALLSQDRKPVGTDDAWKARNEHTPSEYNYLSSSGTSLWPEGSLGPLPLHPSQLNQNTDTKQHITTKYLHSSKIKIIYIQEIKSTHAMKLNKISIN